MASTEPLAGKCGSPLRGKPGQFCTQDPLDGRKRCALHGGRTPRGAGHPHFKHGLDVRHQFVPEDGLTRLQAARKDPELRSLDRDLALVEVLLGPHLQRLNGGGRLNVRDREAVVALMDQRRKLLEAQSKQQERLRLWVPLADVRTLGVALSTAVRDAAAKFVPDQTTRDAMLHDIGQRFNGLMRGLGPGEGRVVGDGRL